MQSYYNKKNIIERNNQSIGFLLRLIIRGNDFRLNQYLEGLEIHDDNVKNGFGVLIVEGMPLGGFKAVNGVLKNYYPKGLRIKI